MTPEQTETTISVAKKIASQFTFPGYTEDDIIQEAWLIMATAVEDGKYDESKSAFETFCYMHLNHRLYTFRRNHYIRTAYDCKHCGSSYDEDCSYCVRRRRNIAAKKSLLTPSPLESISAAKEPTYDGIESSVELGEIFTMIDDHMTGEMREDYLKLLAGVSIPSTRRAAVFDRIHELMGEELDD